MRIAIHLSWDPFENTSGTVVHRCISCTSLIGYDHLRIADYTKCIFTCSGYAQSKLCNQKHVVDLIQLAAFLILNAPSGWNFKKADDTKEKQQKNNSFKRTVHWLKHQPPAAVNPNPECWRLYWKFVIFTPRIKCNRSDILDNQKKMPSLPFNWEEGPLACRRSQPSSQGSSGKNSSLKPWRATPSLRWEFWPRCYSV